MAMSSRQRFRETMQYGRPDRLPYFEEGIRDEVVEVWRRQGLAADADLASLFPSDPVEHIEADLAPRPAFEQWPTSRAELAGLAKRLDPEDAARLPEGWAEEFHTWAMEWDASGVRLSMDDVLYNEWDSSLDRGDGSIEGFQQPHFFILNQAIGGTAGGDASGLTYPTSYVVDYVRLYERAPSP